MKLKASYAAMSDVPTGFEGAYTETDGKAVLTGGDFEFKTEAEFNDVHKAKKKAFDDLHALKDQYKSFEGLDPEKFTTLQEENDVLKAQVKDGGTDEEKIKAIVDVRVARATEALRSENGTLKEQLGEANGFKLKTEKQNILSEILGKQVGNDARADAEFIIGSVLERQADGTYMSNGEAGFEKGLTADQLVSKALESRPHWKKQNVPGHGAGGANGAGGLSKRAQLDTLLSKEAPTRAEQTQMTTLADEIKAEQNEA